METRATPRTPGPEPEGLPAQPPPLQPGQLPDQQRLFPDPPSAGATSATVQASDGVEYRPGELAPVWLQRLNLFIQVMFCIYLGGVVAALPWLQGFWDRNLFLLAHPPLWRFLMLGPVRGVISGLGLLDIWIGLSEAIHYRDVRGPEPERKAPQSRG